MLTFILILAGTVAVAAVAPTAVTKLGARRRARPTKRRTDPSSLIERNGFGAYVDRRVGDHQREQSRRRRRLAAGEARVETLRTTADQKAQTLLGETPNPAWIGLLVISLPIWALATFKIWDLERGILEVLLSPVAPGGAATTGGHRDLAAGLALLTTLVTVGLGFLVMEALRPSGAIPSWRGKALRDRLSLALPLAVLYIGLLAFLAHIAPVRADAIHADAVTLADTACTAATELAGGPGGSGAAAQVRACAQADEAQQRWNQARLWDQGIAIAVPPFEMVVGSVAFEALLLVPVVVRRAEARRRRRSVDTLRQALDDATDDLFDAVSKDADRAGLTAADVDAALARHVVGGNGPEARLPVDPEEPGGGGSTAPGTAPGAPGERPVDDPIDIRDRRRPPGPGTADDPGAPAASDLDEGIPDVV